MVAVARMFARFVHVEPCGQCGACKLHSGTISDTLALVEQGEAEDRDIEDLGARLRMVTNQNRCHLAVQLQTVIASILQELPADFVTHLDCSAASSRPYRLPKIIDMADGAVSYAATITLGQRASNPARLSSPRTAGYGDRPRTADDSAAPG